MELTRWQKATAQRSLCFCRLHEPPSSFFFLLAMPFVPSLSLFWIVNIVIHISSYIYIYIYSSLINLQQTSRERRLSFPLHKILDYYIITCFGPYLAWTLLAFVITRWSLAFVEQVRTQFIIDFYNKWSDKKKFYWSVCTWRLLLYWFFNM